MQSVDEVTAAVLSDTNCECDTLPPTAQLKAVVDIIAPFLDRSLSNGFVPEAFKAAYNTPLLNKSDIDAADVADMQ